MGEAESCTELILWQRGRNFTENLKDGISDLYTQPGIMDLLGEFVWTSKVCTCKTQRDGDSLRKWEIELVMFLLGLLEYVVFWNLHRSLEKPRSLFTCSQVISVNIVLSFQVLHPLLRYSKKLQSSPNMPIGFKCWSVYMFACQVSHFSLQKLLSFCLQLAYKTITATKSIPIKISECINKLTLQK